MTDRGATHEEAMAALREYAAPVADREEVWELGWLYARTQAWIESDAYDEHCFGERPPPTLDTSGPRSVSDGHGRMTFDQMVERLEAKGLNPRPCSKGYMARCPAHDDSEASLLVTEGDNGAFPHCFAGCSQRAIVRELRN